VANKSQPVRASVSWKDNLTVALVESRNPLNIGAAARAMRNFGFTRLALVAPYDAAFREARSAVGAADVLQNAQLAADLDAVLADCTLVAGTATARGRVKRQPGSTLGGAASLLRAHLKRERAALLFGSEKFGLSNEHLSRCQWTLTIPTDPDCPSLNLGQAVAVCCYELARAPASAPRAPARPRLGRATAAQSQRMVEKLLALLDAAGYINPLTRRSQRLKIRRLVERLEISTDDARVLEGMLRQIAWKLDRQSGR